MLVNYSINHPFNPWCFYRCWWMQGEQWGLCSRMQEHKRIIRLHLSIRIPAWCWSKVVHWWVMTTSVSMSNSADRQTDSFLTRWFTCSFTYSLTSTLTNSLTNSLTHSITHSLAEWLTHWLIDISTQYVSVCASVSVCVCLCLCLPVCVSISLQVYLFNHLFVSRSICLCLFLCYGSTKMRKLWFQCSFLLEFSPDVTPIIIFTRSIASLARVDHMFTVTGTPKPPPVDHEPLRVRYCFTITSLNGLKLSELISCLGGKRFL